MVITTRERAVYLKYIVLPPKSHIQKRGGCSSAFRYGGSVLLSIALMLPVLTGCSDNSDSNGSDKGASQPQINAVVEPAEGKVDVVRTSWVTLRFSEPLPTPSSLTAELNCDSSGQEISVNEVVGTAQVQVTKGVTGLRDDKIAIKRKTEVVG